jgi:urocanate hydratase
MSMLTEAGSRTVRAPRGCEISCKGWLQEAALRMLMNNLDPEVAEKPDELVVYGGTGRAARSWADFDRIVAALRELENDETLLVQSGRAVGVFKTHADAPRVLIANSLLVPHWANWDEFRRLEGLGLTMYGQMTAGSWIYIGTQGILQGTYETFGACARAHFGGTLSGRFVLTGGLGGMGGAQPLAATMNEAACLVVEVDQARIEKRIHDRYLDKWTANLDEALAWIEAAQQDGRGLSVGLLGNCGDVLPELVSRNVTPDVLTDQTSAHDALEGYVPNGMTYAEALTLRTSDPDRYVRSRCAQWASTCGHADHAAARSRSPSTTATTFAGQAVQVGVENAFDIRGFVPEYIRPLFCEGQGPFRWCAYPATRQTSPAPTGGARDIPRKRAPVPLDSPCRRAGRVSGAALPHLLAGLWRTGQDGVGIQ